MSDDSFTEYVYTRFSVLKEEIERRRANKELADKVASFFGEDYLQEIQGVPKAVLSRAVTTPNTELHYFLDLANELSLEPIVLEYHDKFVAKNNDKYHLGKLYFYNASKKNTYIESSYSIINFNSQEGKKISEIETEWGESIVTFHHSMTKKILPKLDGKIIDFTNWFDRTKNKTDFYYLYYLALFIKDGVLFDNFLLGDKEEDEFISKKFLPSFVEAERIFGVKPLIYPLLPFKEAKNPLWLSYHKNLRDKKLDT